MDGLERSLQGRAAVLRLDVLSEVGSQAATRYGVRGVPALVVVDGRGQPMLSQAGHLQPDAVLDAVETLFDSGALQ